MAKEVINGANKLLERILDEARTDAAALAKEADEAVSKLNADADREAAIHKQAFDKQCDESARAIMERSRTNAELFARKEALQKRRAVLDRAFEEAYDKLCAYTGEERAAVCRDMLLREAEGAEAICPCKADRATLEKLLPEINAKMQAKGLDPLTLMQTDADGIEHGFLLIGKGYEKDCSFAALLRDTRMLEDTNVSGILFD